MNHEILTALTLIGALTLASQWLSWRAGLPAILFLLAGGLAAGPWFGVVRPDELFGELLFPFVSLSVAAILFEGSLTLRLPQIAGHGAAVRNLVTFGPFITWTVVTLVTKYATETSWSLAFLFGSIMTVTGPTVITPMLRAVRPNRDVSNVLRWEGILIDPVGAILAVLAFNVVISQQPGAALGETAVLLLRLVGAGLVLGALAGQLWGIVLRRYWLPHFLQSVATLLAVFVVFWAADSIEEESGLLAVTVMGVWLANMRGVHVESILDFKENLSILLISALFIILAARLDITQLLAIGWPALIVVLTLQLVGRPLKVFLCTLGSGLSWKERALIGWIGPRGIIAAAISALFAIRLAERGFDNVDLLVPLAFIVIAGTVILQSLTARPLAKMLGLANPAPEGVLFVGANAFSAALAEELREHGFRTLIAGSNWEGLRKARMAGIETFYGSPLSSFAEMNMDMTGIGKVIGISSNTAFNDLVCAHFASTLGRKNVYWLPVAQPDNGDEVRHSAMTEIRGRRLLNDEAALLPLLERLREGAIIRSTKLSDDYTYEDWQANGRDGDIELAAWSAGGRLILFARDEKTEPGDGWTIAWLTSAEASADSD